MLQCAMRACASVSKTICLGDIMHKLMDAMGVWLRRIAYAFAAAGGAAMLTMLALVTANMVLRPFGGTVRGAIEASGYLCALGIGLCMPAAQIAGSHIAAGIWASSLPRFAHLTQKGASALLCTALLFLISRELFGIAEYALDAGDSIEGFGVSYCAVAIGFGIGMALHAAIFLHAFLRMFISPTPPARAQEGA